MTPEASDHLPQPSTVGNALAMLGRKKIQVEISDHEMQLVDVIPLLIEYKFNYVPLSNAKQRNADIRAAITHIESLQTDSCREHLAKPELAAMSSERATWITDRNASIQQLQEDTLKSLQNLSKTKPGKRARSTKSTLGALAHKLSHM